MIHDQASLFDEGTPPYPEVEYFPGYLSEPEANRLVSVFLGELAWEQHFVTLFGKRHACPRLSAWYGEPEAAYVYSDNHLEPIPWTDSLGQLRSRLEQYCSTSFNSVLANLYRSGADSMGWHADNEAELGPEPVIASLSLGAARNMRFRRKDAHRTTAEVWLEHGSLLVMKGRTQAEWHHALPKTKRPIGERINLTFRLISAAG